MLVLEAFIFVCFIEEFKVGIQRLSVFILIIILSYALFCICQIFIKMHKKRGYCIRFLYMVA